MSGLLALGPLLERAGVLLGYADRAAAAKRRACAVMPTAAELERAIERERRWSAEARAGHRMSREAAPVKPGKVKLKRTRRLVVRMMSGGELRR